MLLLSVSVEVHTKASAHTSSRIDFTITSDALQQLAYPTYCEVFENYMDASKQQLGTVIMQNNQPIVFFSRKLSKTQMKYSVTELELLSVVECLKKFKGMLWGQRIKVYTDHKNLVQDMLGLLSDRVYLLVTSLRIVWSQYCLY